MPNKVISWQAPEFRHYQKTYGWYITLISVTVLLAGFFAIQSDIFASVTMILLGLIVMFFARQKPQTVVIELSPKGVKFGNIIFPYKQIKYFWVVYSETHKTVNFLTNTLLNNTMIMELEEQDPEEIRLFLLQYLPEHTETRETSTQKITHFLKF